MSSTLPPTLDPNPESSAPETPEIDREKVWKDILRLHSKINEIKDLDAARRQRILIRRVETPVKERKPIQFTPSHFEPGNPVKEQRKTVWGCAKRASGASSPGSPSSPASTSPTASTPHTVSRFSSSGDAGGPRVLYPPMLKYVAETNKHELPELKPNLAPTVLRQDGPTTKGKWRSGADLDLMEDEHWEIIEVLEDPEHRFPHALVEILVSTPDPTDPNWTAMTHREVKAILQVMRVRMEMEKNQHHAHLPVLVLSYYGARTEDGMDCKSGRIVQAHHDGRQLVMLYSHRFDFSSDSAAAPAALEMFLRCYFCEPVANPESKKVKEGWMQRLSLFTSRSLAQLPGLADDEDDNEG
ncbi:hypothetical protein BJX61DRAFT_540004 [Aspergillus egyptiacus]|nr:hypothetical protein BJX61DRAFT_540004 [Aspergillus egyptiacus]